VVNGDVDYSSHAHPPIRVTNAINGSGGGAPLIYVGGQLINGTIAIDGSLSNASSSTAEIQVVNGTFGSLGAVAINYDGVGGEAWSGGSVLVGSTPYTAQNAGAHVWLVDKCKGDFDNDGDRDGTDQSLFDTALVASTYHAAFPGLEGSRIWHGDCDLDGNFSGSEDRDEIAQTGIVNRGCCIDELDDFLPGDVVINWTVDLSDLTELLSHFGTTSGATRYDGDLTGNGTVDINDLALLLSSYGTGACPTSPPEPLTGSVTISVTGYDTGSYTGGGFSGDKDDFVFDALVTIGTGADDWVGSGTLVTAANGATLRLVPGAGTIPTPTSSIPEKYATFFSVPYAVDDSDRFDSPFPTGGMAGKYSGTGARTYTSSSISAIWYDTDGSSDDGPAAVFRLVINVSGVTGADTSGGFGSVYWSTTGGGGGDIKVADMEFDVAHKYGDSGSSSITPFTSLTRARVARPTRRSAATFPRPGSRGGLHCRPTGYPGTAGSGVFRIAA
jgi:hypothetical protein